MADQTLTYPTDKVVGVAPDRATLDSVHTALRAAGVGDDRIEVSGGETAERGGTDGDDDGVLASVIRTVRTGFGEEATRLRALNEAIDKGQFVVEVELPGEDGDLREQEKRAVGNALHDGGAHHVAFYGRLTVEELQIGA